jgi:pimeloyl-ACP methyl ester carboxylesterase
MPPAAVRTALFALLALVLAGTSPGCGVFRAARAPMPAVTLEQGAPAAECLVVLLPGRFDRPEDFAGRGFAAMAARAGLEARVVAVDAHIGYYRERTAVERLRQDVVLPALAAGRTEIWLAGISLGGLGALAYAREHPDEIAGVVALSPYLGRGEVLGEIEQAGGLARWSPAAPAADEPFTRPLWRWLRRYADGEGPVPILLGYGRDEYLARGHRLLAAELPGEQVFVIDGGHDWKTWTPLWQRILAAGPCRSR